MKVSSNTILTREQLDEAIEHFMRFDAFAFDVETVGQYRGVPHLNQVTWISLATYGKSVVIPMGHPHGTKIVGETKEPRKDKNGKVRMFRVPVYEPAPEQLTPAEVFSALKPLFFDPERIKIAHNVVFDTLSSEKYFGEEIPGRKVDTLSLQHVLDENLREYGLKPLVKKHFKFTYEEKDVGKIGVDKFPFNEVAYYSYCDSLYCWLLYTKNRPLIDVNNLVTVYDMECDVIEPLVGMKRTGAPVDEEELYRLRDELSARLEEKQAAVIRAAGKEFNLNAPGQKAHVLYDPKSKGGQGLKPWKPTKGGKEKKKKGMELDVTDYSTDSDALESYPENPVAVALLEYQEVNKILSTYVLGYLGVEGDKDKPCIIYDGKIHADFVPCGPVTGRFSCRAPNLQNIPRPDTDLGKKIRGLFVAEPGQKLIVADYDQIELVILAHYLHKAGNGGKLYDGFMNGVDPHTTTAAGVLGKKPEDVTSAERTVFGKTLNFATNYGVWENKVAAMLSGPDRVFTVKEARGILATHREEFPEIYAFKEAVWKKARSRTPVPYLRTLSGRMRRLPDLNHGKQFIRESAQRQAFNSLIQGGNADLIKWALIRAHRMLPEDIKIILTVHDEIVLTAPEDRVELGVEILREAMYGPEMQSLLCVPMKADVKVVSRWSEAK